MSSAFSLPVPSSSSSSSPSPNSGGARTAQALIAVKRKQGEPGSLVKMLVKLIRGDTIELADKSEFDLDDFIREFANGGKFAIEQDWRVKNGAAGKSAAKEEYFNKEADDIALIYEKEKLRGQHEWIPTSEIAYVAEFCAKNRNYALLSMASSLRSPTEDVIFDPDYYKDFTGHVGSLYTHDGKAVTVGQASFHNELRKLLYQCFHDHHADFTAYHSGLEAFFTEHCWDGTRYTDRFLACKFITIDKRPWNSARLLLYQKNVANHQQRLLKDIRTFASQNASIQSAPPAFSFFMPNNSSMGIIPGTQPTTTPSSQPMITSSANSGPQPMTGVTKMHQ